MEQKNFKFAVLSGNLLKIIAAIFMVIDHAGLMLFYNNATMRILGRLSYPIFAFMIAEGCRYTKNKVKYFALVFGFGVVFQIVYYVAEKSLFMSIFITFALSIMMIYALQYLKKQLFAKKWLLSGVALMVFACTIALTYHLNQVFLINYRFWGSMLPVFISLFHADEKDENQKVLQSIDCIPLSVLMATIGMIMIWFDLRTSNFVYQEFAVLCIPLLLLYSGKRGKRKMKYFFYFFFPIHLVVLHYITYFLGISYFSPSTGPQE